MKLAWNPFETFLKHYSNCPEMPLKFSWNHLKTPLKYTWNSFEASLKHPKNTPKTPSKYSWPTPETYLKHARDFKSWNILKKLLKLKIPWNTFETFLKHPWDFHSMPLNISSTPHKTSLRVLWNFPEKSNTFKILIMTHAWNSLNTPLKYSEHFWNFL